MTTRSLTVGQHRGVGSAGDLLAPDEVGPELTLEQALPDCTCAL